MKYLLILNLFLTFIFVSNQVVFLQPATAEANYKNKFGLSKEDIRMIQYLFIKNTYYNDFSNLPKNTRSKKINSFFRILKNKKDKRWISAYLFLLSIIPSLFEEDLGC